MTTSHLPSSATSSFPTWGPESGATRPDLVPSAELAARLTAQLMRRNRLGDATAGLLRGDSPSRIAADCGVSTAGWVRNKRWTLNLLFGGQLPMGPRCREAVMNDLNGLVKRVTDPEVLAHILRARAAVQEEAITEQAIAQRVRDAFPVEGCVYAAVWPTYYQLASLFKVGHVNSSTGLPERMYSLRATGSPEAPLVARTYSLYGMKPGDLETLMHLRLRKRGLGWARIGAGKEWFRGSLAEVDEVADEVGATAAPGLNEVEVIRLSRSASEVLELSGIAQHVDLSPLATGMASHETASK